MTGNRMLLLLPALLLGVLLEAAQAQAPRTAPRPAGAGMKTVLPLPDTQDFERDRQTLVYLQKMVERIIQALSLEAEARRQTLKDVAVQLHTLANGTALPVAPKVRKQMENTLLFFKTGAEIPVFQLLDEQKVWRELETEITQAVKRQGQLLDALRLMHKASQEDSRKLANLVQAETQLLVLLKEKNEVPVRQVLDQVRREIAGVPPPALFTNSVGIDLVPLPPDNAWYISKVPVTWRVFVQFLNETASALAHRTWSPDRVKVDAQTGVLVASHPEAPVTEVSWNTAAAFCFWLTEKTKPAAKYELPGQEQLQAWAGGTLIALWCRDPWGQGTPLEQQMRERFSVNIMTIWDPAKRLGFERTVGEVTFAAYPDLGFCLVTKADTVRQERMLRLRKELNLPVTEEK